MALLSTIQEAFTNSSTPTGWTLTTLGSATATQNSTGCSINLPASTTSSTDGDMNFTATNDLTGSFARINILGVSGASATHTDNVLRVRQNATNYYTIFYEAGTLFFSKVVTSAQTNIASVAFNATNHAWWQIRHKGATVYGEVSSDGITWLPLAAAAFDPTAITITAVDVLIGAICFGVDTNPSPFKFRYFNYPLPGTTTSTSSTSVSSTSTSLSSTSSSSTSSSISTTSTSTSFSSTSTTFSSTSSSISSTSSSISSTSSSSTSSSTSISSTSSSVSSTSQSSTSQSSTSSSLSISSTSTSLSSTSSSISSTSASISSTSASSTSSSSSTSTTAIPLNLTYSYQDSLDLSSGLSVRTGTYTGNGTSQSITGVGFKPDFLIIKGGSSIAQVGMAEMGANQMQDITGSVKASLRLASYDPNGFSVGNDATVNTNGTTYYYLAIKDRSGTSFAHGGYNGTAAGPRSIFTGFQPDLVMIWDDLGDSGGFRTSSMATDSWLDYGGTTGILADRVLSLDSGGFTVDFRNETNGSGRNYFWVAFKKLTNMFNVFTYSGNGTDATPVNGVGFSPEFALTNNGSVTPAAAAIKFNGESGSNSFLANATGEGTTNIQTFTSDGITVGTGTSANTTGVTYYGIAFNSGDAPRDDVNPDTNKNVQNVAVDDGDYFIQYASEYGLQEYKRKNTNNSNTPSFTWKGRTTESTLTSPFWVQIYNVNTAAWETLAVVNKVPADTDFTVKVAQTANTSNYYDPNNTVTFRTYQQVI